MIPDAIFLELSTAFGKPSAAEVELLQEQQRALYEGGSESKALIELAIEGGFLTPAEAEKFVRLAKLQDVGAPTPPAKAPSERTRAKAPSERTRTKAPSERTRTKAPSERARTKAPSERTRTKAPSERARTKAPSERARTRGPSERVERSASGRHAAGSSSPLVAAVVAGLVFACLGLAYVFTRPPESKPQVARDDDEGPRTAEDYLELARGVRRATLERLDRGQGEKAMTALRARIHEWSQIPAAAAAVLELDLLRSELADELEARKAPTPEEELAGPEEIPHANRFPTDPSEAPEEEA
ncbi:MAG: hypothetical protein KDD82_23635, partial [Planctomycetes bacterium]|nr:hypothetical protein [Planctomycetota bacterium]